MRGLFLLGACSCALALAGGCVRGPDPLPLAPDASSDGSAPDGDVSPVPDPDASAADAAPPPPAPLDLGVTFSPIGFGGPFATWNANRPAFFAARATHGRVVAYHIGWRDPGAVRPSCGTPPAIAQLIEADAATYGFTLSIVLGWSSGAGDADLSCAPELVNDWSSATTRARYKDVAVQLATQLKPAYLFLGNEVNTWFLKQPAGWASWLSELTEVAAAVRAASPTTKIGTVYQHDHLRGGGTKNGWSDPPQWQLVSDVAGKVDVLGVTSYPYFDHDTPAAVPADHYAELSAKWSGPIAVTETAWRATASVPYAGDPTAQAAWPARMMDLLGPRLRYATWIFLNDLDPSVDLGPFSTAGLRDANGIARPVDAAWRSLVAGRQYP